MSAPEPPLLPHFPVPSHEEPRFSCFVESEAAGVSVLWIFHLNHVQYASKCKSIYVAREKFTCNTDLKLLDDSLL